MNADIELDVLLRGRKFKKMLGDIYKELRSRYGLKQVEIEVLLYLGLMPDVSSTELAKELSLQKGHVSMAMFGLCEKGYLNAEQSLQDRRFVNFRITREGERVREEIVSIKDEINQHILRGFSEKEIRTLEKLTSKLLDNVDGLQI